jgi:hypothetical protein
LVQTGLNNRGGRADSQRGGEERERELGLSLCCFACCTAGLKLDPHLLVTGNPTIVLKGLAYCRFYVCNSTVQ